MRRARSARRVAPLPPPGGMDVDVRYPSSNVIDTKRTASEANAPTVRRDAMRDASSVCERIGSAAAALVFASIGKRVKRRLRRRCDANASDDVRARIRDDEKEIF